MVNLGPLGVPKPPKNPSKKASNKANLTTSGNVEQQGDNPQ